MCSCIPSSGSVIAIHSWKSWCNAGKGLECALAEDSQGTRSSVLFGSLDYIRETLHSSQSTILDSLTSGLQESSVVSVLVKSPAEAVPGGLPDSSVLLRCSLQPPLQASAYLRHDLPLSRR